MLSEVSRLSLDSVFYVQELLVAMTFSDRSLSQFMGFCGGISGLAHLLPLCNVSLALMFISFLL